MQDFTMLDHLLKVAPLLNQSMPTDVAVAICDQEKWVFYSPAKSLDLKITFGDPVLEGTAAYTCLQKRKRVVVENNDSLYGVPYMAVGLPIFSEHGELLGVLVCCENNQHRATLLTISKDIQGYLQNLQGPIQEIAAEAEELSATSQELRSVTEDATVKVESTAGILDTVKQIAKRTNLIGLNASIEAARVGEYGKGFNVVANEVRNLSQMSNASTVEIGNIVNSIKDAIKSIDNATQMVSEVSQSQAGKLSAINSVLDEFGKMAEKLVEAADLLLKDNINK